MKLFNSFESSAPSQEDLAKNAEKEIDVLKSDIDSKNWSEIYFSLNNSALNSPSLIEKMSGEKQEEFKSLISSLKSTFEQEKDNIDPELFIDLENVLKKY